MQGLRPLALPVDVHAGGALQLVPHARDRRPRQQRLHLLAEGGLGAVAAGHLAAKETKTVERSRGIGTQGMRGAVKRTKCVYLQVGYVAGACQAIPSGRHLPLGSGVAAGALLRGQPRQVPAVHRGAEAEGHVHEEGPEQVAVVARAQRAADLGGNEGPSAGRG